ncbi:hypothetical protein ACVWWI_006405 [Bradyrhizobium sp. USDA 3686]|nr:hypothetical protein [Bradyrhizobium canariense]MCS3765712.1 hypothetical protein [Bradyrhizobium centrosematis]MCS3777938.1 hypothetical protein [Bradyrhizobium centrosematis]
MDEAVERRWVFRDRPHDKHDSSAAMDELAPRTAERAITILPQGLEVAVEI